MDVFATKYRYPNQLKNSSVSKRERPSGKNRLTHTPQTGKRKERGSDTCSKYRLVGKL